MGRTAVLVPVLAFLLVSCAVQDAPADIVPRQGSGAATPPGGEASAAAVRLARAPAATAAAGTAHTTVIATVGGLPGRSEPLTLRGQGTIDFVAGTSRSILDLSGALETAPTSATELETISSGGLVYVRAPMLTSFSGASEPWVRIDPMATAHHGAGALAPLTGLAGSDVGAPLALLNGVDRSSVRELRQADQLDGDTTTLLATVDVSAAASTGATPQHDLAALQRVLDRLGARRLEVEVELDDADRLRRLVYEHAVPTPTGPASQHFEIRYENFGATVDIERPLDVEVRDLLAR